MHLITVREDKWLPWVGGKRKDGAEPQSSLSWKLGGRKEGDVVRSAWRCGGKQEGWSSSSGLGVAGEGLESPNLTLVPLFLS